MPRKRAFMEAGLGELHKALSSHGGQVHWAKEFGVLPWLDGHKRVEKDDLERLSRRRSGSGRPFPAKRSPRRWRSAGSFRRCGAAGARLLGQAVGAEAAIGVGGLGGDLAGASRTQR